MSKSFPMVPLDELLIKSEERVEIDPGKYYRQVTVRLWGKGVVLRGVIAGTDLAGSNQFCVKTGQFILSKIDARNGAFGLIPNSLDGAVVSPDFPIFTPNTLRIMPKFLDWISKTRNFVSLCSAASEGTTNRIRLKVDRFLATPIPLPSPEEQLRIVARIEQLAAKIEEARGLRKEAVEEAEMIVDMELDKLIVAIAETAKITIIGNSEGFVTSGPRGWGTYYNESGSRRLIRVENVINKVLDLSMAARVEVPSYEGDIERSQVQIGDVLVTITGAAIGRVGVVHDFDIPCHVSQHVALIRAPKEIYPYYLYWYLKSPTFGRSQTEGKTYGATKPGINLTDLRMLRVTTPSLSQQYSVVAYLDDLQSKVDSLKCLQAETSAELDALLPSILDKAFKGEL